MSKVDHPLRLEPVELRGDGRQFSPSAARNCGPIREVLIRVLPNKGIALEIGSGTGEHVISFAKALPGLVWLPSDPDAASRASIKAWRATEGLTNVHAPVAIDVRERIWGVEDDAPFDAMISLNMVHIAPWEAALGLLAGAGRLLKPDGVLVLYGPFMRGGTHTAASNVAFDADLKRRDPCSGSSRRGRRRRRGRIPRAWTTRTRRDACEQSFARLCQGGSGLASLISQGRWSQPPLGRMSVMGH